MRRKRRISQANSNRSGDRAGRRDWALGILVTLLLLAGPFLAFDAAQAQPAPGCRVAGNNIFCDSCAAAQNAPLVDRQVTLSDTVNANGQTNGSNNSFCRIDGLAPGEDLTLTVADSGSINLLSFDANFTRVGAMPGSLTPNPLLNQSVPANGSITRSFSHSEAMPVNTSVNVNIADTQPNGQPNAAVSGTVTCGCAPARGTLTINKVAIGGDDTFPITATLGANAPLDFSITTAGGTGQNSQPVLTGTYTVAETPPAGWVLDSIVCGDQTTDQAVVSKNTTTVCTVTNRKLASVTIKKRTLNGTGAFDFAATTVPGGQGAIAGFTETTNAVNTPSAGMTLTNLVPGDYTFTETPPVPGWTLTGLSCTGTGVSNPSTNGLAGSFTLADGAVAECIYENTLARSSLTIVKDVPGVGNNTPFSFSNNGPQAPAAFQLADGQSQVFTTTGTYIISETQAPGFNLTNISCTGTGANGQGDVIDVAGGSTTVDLDPGEHITCTFRNVPDEKTGRLIVRKVTVGGDDKFNFSVTGQPGFNLGNGDQRIFANLAEGNYTVGESNLPDGWKLQNVSCTGGGNKAGNGITVSLSANQTITCTFTNFKKRDDRMREVTRLFIHRRVDNLLTHGPDRARLLRRLQPQDPPACGLKDDCSQPPPLKLGAAPTGTGAAPRIGGVGTPELPAFGNQAFGNPAYGQSNSSVLFANEEDDQPWNPRGGTSSPLLSSIMGQLSSAAGGSSSFKFGTSLSELRESGKAAQLQEEQKKLQEAGLDYNGQMYHMPKNALHQRLDIWVEGQFSGYNDSTGGLHRDGNFRVLYVGADYAIAPGVLVGALVQVDDTRENIDDPTLLGEVEGTGWMAGPYIGIKLTDTLYFDARAAWGTSDNDIWLQDAAAGWRSGSFETDRWLANANLTGNYQFGNWRLSPQVGVAYGQESYDTYFNSLGQIVDGGEARIGRVTGGAEVGYQFRHSDGSVLEPHIGIKGIWNFQTDDLFVNGVLVDTDESRAQIEGGLLYRTPSGMAVRGALAYDGIGADDFESYTGQLWVNIPLN